MTIGRSLDRKYPLAGSLQRNFALGHLVKAPVRERGPPLYRTTSFLSFIQTDAFINLPANRKQPSVFFTSGFCSFLFFFGKSLTRVSHLPHKQKVPKSLLCPPSPPPPLFSLRLLLLLVWFFEKTHLSFGISSQKKKKNREN